ncbi:MAG: radical SAM protein [bacterium]
MIVQKYLAARVAAQTLIKLGSVYLRRRRPFVVNHLITVRCNLACPFCYVSGPEQRSYNREHYPRSAELDTAEVRDFYRQLIALDFRLIVIVGGEPLLRPDLDDLLRPLQGRIFSSVFTNGMLLADRHELVRRASSLFVSLDAPDRQHDELRAQPGCFDRALAGVEAMRRHHPRVNVSLMMTVTDNNVHRVPEMLAFSRRLGLPVGFQPPSYDGQFALADRPETSSAGNVPRAALVADAFRAIRDATRTQRVAGSRAFFQHVIDNRASYPCYYPSYVLGPIYPNGDVIGCTQKRVIGSVRKSPVAALLRGAPFQANAAAGPGCQVGCRDWGIHDISAMHSWQLGPKDLHGYYRSFVM